MAGKPTKRPKQMDYDYVKKMIRESSLETSIYVGCDSQVKARITDFVTVVIIHIDSKHGARLYHNIEKIERRMALRERLWKEVELAGMCALEIEPVVGARPFSIHLDLNSDPKHRSNVITKEATAYIRALGLTPIIKPDAFAASHAADHIIRK